MAKKAIRREDVEIRWFTDDKFDGTRIEKNRHIFKRKDGTEYITSMGDVTRDPTTGKLYCERRCKTVQALNIMDIVKKVKETGGQIVILPP
jgi:hypothetical protein